MRQKGNKMKAPIITRIDICPLNVRLIEPFKIALGVVPEATNVLIRIHTSDGLTGLGEASPFWFITGDTQATDLEAARPLAQLLIGKNPLAIESRMRELDAFLTHNTTIKSAFDMALYDLLGKVSGLPLYALLGGEKRSFVTDLTVSIDAPEVMAAHALEIRRMGFKAIKAKLGSGRADDVARIRAIRAAVGPDVALRIDANQGWDPATASLTLNDLAAFNIEYCEQPVARWNIEALRHLRTASPIPIMADESLFDHHDAVRLASMGACDYFNIKLSKSGGIHTALKINAVAEGAGIPCMVGSMVETRLAMSAAAHLVSARPNIIFADLDSPLMHAEDPIEVGITYDHGQVILSDAPGHGADLKPEVAAALKGITVTA
jgi:L-alanine-DL-glutamate epimerase-like enolase superfamily enzyme